jgi:SRSO17 transposase
MTPEEIAGLGPAFRTYLRRFRACFARSASAGHFDTYCRGRLSDLPRKSVEPIALAANTAVRTLQEFLATSRWDHERARGLLHRHLGAALASVAADDLGTVGTVDETSCRKWGDQTPGVQRQYLGCEGKIENGIVTVHLGVARGTFRAILDADLYLPRSWDADRDRCREAGVPDAVRCRAKWKLALDQYLRAHEAGLRFDWLVFDEGYGGKVPFLWVLGRLGQRFVGEVPVNFMVRRAAADRPVRADGYQPATRSSNWRRFRLARKTVADQVWRATSTRVWVARGGHVLVTAINERTGEVQYLVSNAVDEPLGRVLRAAFRRATIEHAFRLAKQEAGLMHDEGRSYTGLMRHLTLALIVLGFVAEHTERLRGEKPGGDSGAGVPGVEHPVRGGVPPPPRHDRTPAHQRGHSIPPGTKPAGADLTQETAAQTIALNPRCTARDRSFECGTPVATPK